MTGTRGGLREPLIDRPSNRNTSVETRDLENGIVQLADDDAVPVPLIKRPYRIAATLVASADLIGTLAIAWYLEGWKCVWPSTKYTLNNSIVDIVWISMARSISILIQSSSCVSLRASKIVGYTSLLSLLFLIVKLCYSTGLTSQSETEDSSVLVAEDNIHMIPLLLTSFACCFAECILQFLIGIYSADDLSTTVAPTASQAAEGIATGDAKSISLWKLLLVLKPYFWPEGLINRGCVFLTWVFLICSKAANILAPLCIAKATDVLSSGNAHDHRRQVVKYIIFYALLLLSNKFFKEAQALAYVRVKLIAGVQLKEQVFSHLLGLSMDWHQRKSTGTVVTAMQRGINASNMVVQYIFLYLLPTLIEACVVALVFVREFGAPLLAAVAICGCTIYICCTVELTIYRMQFRKRMNKADNDAGHKVTDALLNIETVKYFTAEDHEVHRYRESVETFKDQAGKIQISMSTLNTSQQIVLNCTLVAALLVAATEYNKGDFSVGQFVAVNVYVLQLFAPLNFLGSIYSMAVGSYVDLQNLCNIMAEKPDIQDKEDAQDLVVRPTPPPITSDLSPTRTDNNNTPPALGIEFRDVVFAYPSRKEVAVLKGISFTVSEGSTTAIVGATGSGKSTLLALLLRFYEADQGEVIVGNKNVLDLTQKSLRGHIGVVPQDHALFNDTLKYNIMYGDRGADDTSVQTAVQGAQLSDFISSLPDGLETLVGERGQQISGGQKQRIAIARVLMKDCPIVVLDEATSSLDSRTEEQIQASLESLRGRTKLVIAHRLSTIQHADQIIVMSSGEILESGSHEELLALGKWHEQCYASLWDKQKKVE